MSNFYPHIWTVRELQKLGAKIQVCGSTALVFGRETRRYTALHSEILDFMIIIKSNLILLIPLNSIISALHGSQLRAADLRGGVALVLAGLVAEGTTEISGIGHIGRGYENLDTKLQFLGADIKRSIPMASQLWQLWYLLKLGIGSHNMALSIGGVHLFALPLMHYSFYSFSHSLTLSSLLFLSHFLWLLITD